jgi:hypothetical protein
MTGSPLVVPQLNLAFAWVWIFLGFASGAWMGLRFKDEKWLGGYSSFPRRLIRLGHISFFGLGLINFLFFFTVHALGAKSHLVDLAAGAFLTGGVLMPICCGVMAFRNSARPALLFAPPVTSLLLGGALTLYLVLKP